MATKTKRTKRVDDEYTSNDVGRWGGKADGGNADYREPFRVGGEAVDLDALPAFGDDEANVDARAPLLPPGSP